MLGTRYRAGHIAGAALCVLGLAVLVISDGSLKPKHSDDHPYAAWGDALVLSGAGLYSLCNVMQEGLLGMLRAAAPPAPHMSGFPATIFDSVCASHRLVAVSQPCCPSGERRSICLLIVIL